MMANATTVGMRWSAPKPKPIAMAKNKFINSSGSLIAVRNLTIESAPTRPSDNARDDLTIEITKSVIRANKGRLKENLTRFESDVPYFP